MKIYAFLLIYLIFPLMLLSKTITVGFTGDYTDLTAALSNAVPGDTVMLLSEKHKVNQYIKNIKGSPDKWIIITSNADNPAIFEGGSTAFQLSDASYLKISNITFSGQTGNGLNIDDGGSYDSPTESIIIENCAWLSMNATGNNDELKMSGVDNFEIRNCKFMNGSAGGSMIDMVGCHKGKIYKNIFQNAGSNAIQAKGGCSVIDIYQNLFQNAGQRSINVGGSTGLQFFRPPDAKYEARDIRVFINQFRGSVAPIAFVGAINCSVINNLLFMPERWLVRILQENITDGFALCSNNIFANNICYFDNNANNERGINIGSNTLPATFEFSNNLWFNTQNSNWNGPNPAVNHQNTILNQDPELIESGLVFKISGNSPAVGKGVFFDFIKHDYFGESYNNPPSIGPSEGNPPISGIFELRNSNIQYYNFLSLADFQRFISNQDLAQIQLIIYDFYGKENINSNIDEFISQNLNNISKGLYFYSISNGRDLIKSGMIINF
jgi:hypothetical protein